MSEASERERVIEHLKIRCADDATWWTVLRGIKSTSITSEKSGPQGWRAGVPGLCFIKAGKPLFIDMKRNNVNWNSGHNTVSDEQLEMHREITQAGGRVAICFGADETIKQLEDWGILV